MYWNLAIFAAFAFLYSVASGRIERTPFSGALVFIVFGVALGPVGLDLLKLDIAADGISVLAEMTLALVLFTDAANANLGVLRRSFHIPQRLLLIGLPLTILFGYGFGVLLFGGLTLMEVAVLATMLAPTDAALGKAVVTNTAVPGRIREGLNVESGLNDGICVPILFVFLGCCQAGGVEQQLGATLLLVLQEIGVGLAVGVALALIGAHLVRVCSVKGRMNESWEQLPVIALSLLCFAVAQALGGSGFIACFAGGFLFGVLIRSHKKPLLLAAEGTGDTLALITWVVFGAAVVGQTLMHLSWNVVLYAVLSLTVVRMVPVFVCLTGLKLGVAEKLFMGWFGPRGLASVVFAVIVLNKELPGCGPIGITVACTIILSIVAHGISANPLITGLVSRLKRRGGQLR